MILRLAKVFFTKNADLACYSTIVGGAYERIRQQQGKDKVYYRVSREQRE